MRSYKTIVLPFFLLIAGLLFVGCDSSGSNSSNSETTTYEFEGLWKHEGGGEWGGGGYEHYLDVSGKELTKHQVTLDVDGNRVGCETDTQTIESYDKGTNMVTLNGELHSDGSKIKIKVESGTLTYQPKGDDVDEYQKVEELPQGAASRCGWHFFGNISNLSSQNGSLLSETGYTDGSVENGTTYHYVVTAVDTAENASGPSNEVEKTPFDDPPDRPGN